MGKRIIKITESDLTKIVKRVIKEQQNQLTSGDVYEIQNALREYFKLKRINVQIPVDGKWGPKTIEALKLFQSKEGLDVDGIPGKDTYDAFHKLGLHEDLIDKLMKWVGNIFK